MKKGWIGGIVLLLVISGLVGGLKVKFSPIISRTVHNSFKEDEYYDEYEKKAYQFLKNHMLSFEGGIFSGYASGKDMNTMKQQEMLSESQGLYMLYMVQKGDKNNFDKALAFVKNKLLSNNGIILWRTHEKNIDMATGNVVRDDLRIIKALMEAHKRWELATYEQEAQMLSLILYVHNVKENELYDYYDVKEERVSDNIRLSSFDFSVLSGMKAYKKEWEEIEKRSLKIVEEGYLGTEFPFYYPIYHYGTKAYGQEKTIDMEDNLLTVLHLTEIGLEKEETIDWLKEELKRGAVFKTYDEDGMALTTEESGATYATIAQIGKIRGDISLYTLAIEKLLTFQNNEGGGELKGAFINKEEEVNSYDNLQALLAF